MDTSETYIKQCDCPEIQEKWNPNIYDFAVKREGYHKLIPTIKIHNKFYYIFLPRQDKIQEMCGTYHNDKNGRWFCWICTMGRFNRFLEGFINQDFEHEIECFNKHKDFKMPSMEQLCL